MGNRFVLILAACAVLFVGLLVFNKKEDAGAPSSEVTATNHTQGEGTADVTLVEYGDFECVVCYRFYPVLKQVKEKYGDKITFQFRHFPIVNSHPNAMAAHRAAEAAGKQGKFWEMHDLLYENWQSWEARVTKNPTPLFESYAQSIGLDMEKYKTDVASSEINSIINKDMAEASKLNVDGTPTFFLNGEKLTDARDNLDYFSEKIDAAIADSKSE